MARFAVAALLLVTIASVAAADSFSFETRKIGAATYYKFDATELIGGEGGKFPEAPGEILAYKNAITAGGIKGDVIAFINGYFVLTSAAADGEEAWFEQTQTVVFTAGPFKGSSLTIAGAYAFGANPPLSIVGGTGKFAGARGVYSAGADPDSEHAASLHFVFTTEGKIAKASAFESLYNWFF
jgi:hypothetical protein